jgi:peptidoglycan/LPS O-acetylase OafA/YrhL
MTAKQYIPSLTGVRGLASILIFFHHFNQTDFPPLLFRVLNEFHFPLSMFFVLSGFLICLRYYDNVELSGKWMRKYLKNRIARVYPIYLILTIVVFLFAWIANDNSIYNGKNSPMTLFIMNITFLRGFFDDMKFTGIAQGWSLTVEECFYFSAPIFFILIKRSKIYFLIAPLVITAVGVLLVLIFRNVDFYGFFKSFKFLFISTFLGRTVEFFAGMVLAMIIRKADDSVSNVSLYTWLGIIGIACTNLIMINQPISKEVPFALYQPIGIFTNNVLLPIAIATFFYGLIKENSVVKSILGSKTGELVGKSSYILYLIHLGFISNFISDSLHKYADQFYAWLDKNEYWWLSEHLNYTALVLLSHLFILTIISIILYKFIEEPINLYIRKSNFLEKKTV